MSKSRQVKVSRRQRAQRQMLLILGGVVLVALALIGASVYQNNRPVGEITPIVTQTYPFVYGLALGKADAPIKIQLFSDFQCPYCGLYARNYEQQLINDYVATGQVRFEYKHFLVVDGNTGGNESHRAAIASECAGEQGQFWNFHDLLFANQNGEGRGAFADRRLKAFAQTLGLNQTAFNACLDSGRFTQAISADESLARSLEVSGTPTLFVNGQRINNPLDYAEVKQAISSALSAR